MSPRDRQVQSRAVSDFFEPPPKPEVPEPRHYRMPPWLGPPHGTLPGVVASERILARTDKVAVCVTRLAAYPTGFELDVVTMSSDDEDGLASLMFDHHHPMHRWATDEIPPELLRFGVQFSDGSKATSTGDFHHDHQPPARPVMNPGGGGGGGGSWCQTQWVWPLPPPGTLTLVCEWPAMDIPLTRSELDAQLILDAAARAQVIFYEEHLPEPPDEDDGPSPGGWTR